MASWYELFRVYRRLDRLERKMASIDQLSQDFGKFKNDWDVFVAAAQAFIKNPPSGITPAQQTLLDTMDASLNSMDTTIQGIPVPPAAPETGTSQGPATGSTV